MERRHNKIYLNKELMEYKELVMERFNKEHWTNRTWKNEFIRR